MSATKGLFVTKHLENAHFLPQKAYLCSQNANLWLLNANLSAQNVILCWYQTVFCGHKLVVGTDNTKILIYIHKMLICVHKMLKDDNLWPKNANLKMFFNVMFSTTYNLFYLSHFIGENSSKMLTAE